MNLAHDEGIKINYILILDWFFNWKCDLNLQPRDYYLDQMLNANKVDDKNRDQSTPPWITSLLQQSL